MDKNRESILDEGWLDGNGQKSIGETVSLNTVTGMIGNQFEEDSTPKFRIFEPHSENWLVFKDKHIALIQKAAVKLLTKKQLEAFIGRLTNQRLPKDHPYHSLFHKAKIKLKNFFMKYKDSSLGELDSVIDSLPPYKRTWRKKVCKRGHDLSLPQATYNATRGYKQCKACSLGRQKKYEIRRQRLRKRRLGK